MIIIVKISLILKWGKKLILLNKKVTQSSDGFHWLVKNNNNKKKNDDREYLGRIFMRVIIWPVDIKKLPPHQKRAAELLWYIFWITIASFTKYLV